MLPNLSELPLVAAVGAGSPDLKRPRPDEEAGPSDAIAPTGGRWWPVHKDINNDTFRVSITLIDDEKARSQVLSIQADPTRHVAYDTAWHSRGTINQLWDQVTLLREQSLGEGKPVAAIYTARPNMRGYGTQEELLKETELDERVRKELEELKLVLEQERGDFDRSRYYKIRSEKIRNSHLGVHRMFRDDVLVHAFGANDTSLPPTRVPDEIHMIVNLLTPNPGDCGWCNMAIGVVPVPADDEEAQNEALGGLMAACPFVEVEVVR